MKKQISKNVSSNYFVIFLGMLLGLLIVPFLIKKLGKNAFGLIVLAESTIVFFEVVTISVRMALSRHATFSLGQGKDEEFIEYLSTGRYLLFISTGLVFLAGLLLSYNFPHIFRVPDIFVLQSKILFFLISIAFSISIPFVIFWSILYAKQRFDLINISSVTGRIFRAVAIFILFSILPPRYVSLITYGFIYLFMILIENYFVYWWHRRVAPGIRLSVKNFKYDKVKSILSFSAHASLSRISFLLYDNAANILINLFWGTGFNAIYAVSLKISTIMKRLFMETSWTLTPTFTDLAAKDDKERFELLLIIYTKLISIVTTPLFLSLIFMSKPIMLFWVGEDFLMAARILPIHIIPLFAIVPFAVTGCITNAYAKVKIPARVSLGAAILNVILVVVLGKLLSLRLFGVAMAAAISGFLASAVFLPYYACRVSNISLKKCLLESFIKPFILMGVVTTMVFIVANGLGIMNRIDLISLSVMAVSVFISYLLGYLFILSAGERAHVKDIVKIVVGKKLLRKKSDA